MKTKPQIEYELNLVSESVKMIKHTIENTPDKYEDKSYYEADISILKKHLTLLDSLKEDIEELIAQDDMSMSKGARHLKEKLERLFSVLSRLLEHLSSTDWQHLHRDQNSDRKAKEVWPNENANTATEEWEISAKKTLELMDAVLLRIDKSRLDNIEGELISYQDILDKIKTLTETLHSLIKTCPHNKDLETLKIRCFEAIDLLHVQNEIFYLRYKRLSDELLAYEKKGNSFEFLIHNENNLIKLPKLIVRFLDELKNPNNYVFSEHKKKYDELIEKWNKQLVLLNQKLDQKSKLESKLFEIEFINPIQENLKQLREDKTRLLFLINDTLKLLVDAESHLNLWSDPQLNFSYLSFIKSNLEQFTKLREDYDFIQRYLNNKVSKKESRPLYQTCLDKIQAGNLLSLHELMQLYSKKGHSPNLFKSEQKTQFKTALKSIFETSCPFLEQLKEHIETQTQISYLSKKHPIEYSQKEINQILKTIQDGNPLRELLTGLLPKHLEEKAVIPSSSSP